MALAFDGPYHIAIEIQNDRCKVRRMLQGVGIERFRVLDVRVTTKGLVRHLVKVPSHQIHKIPNGMLVKARGNSKFETKTETWFDSDGCNVCSTILSHGSFLISARDFKDESIVYSFIAPNFDAFKGIIPALEESGLKPKLLKVEKHEPKGKILTEKQERVLWLALRMGLFDYPRKTNALELSRKLEIQPSTLSEITRRGVRRLLESHFETQ